MTILNREHLRSFHRKLYAGFNQTVKLHKRRHNQGGGYEYVATLFNCRWSRIFGAKEPQDDDITAAQSRTLHVPRSELDLAGVDYVEFGDKFEDEDGRFWMSEATTTITNKLTEEHLDVPCLRVNH